MGDALLEVRGREGALHLPVGDRRRLREGLALRVPDLGTVLIRFSGLVAAEPDPAAKPWRLVVQGETHGLAVLGQGDIKRAREGLLG
jgi:hypothetical protein